MAAEETTQTKAQKRKAKQKRQEANRARKKTLSIKVFGITELLEKVLLNLPLKDLLFAQGVCKAWKTIIDRSPSLQKALFFKPAASGVVYMHERDKPCRLTNEDFFYAVPLDEASFKVVKDFQYGREMIVYFSQKAKEFKRANETAKQATYEREAFKYLKQAKTAGQELRTIASRTRIFINPLLDSKIKWFGDLFTPKHQNMQFISIDLKKDLDLHPSARRKEASWRRMHITQPPLATFPAFKKSPFTGYASVEWNILGLEYWTEPILMDKFRTEMARWKMCHVKAQKPDLFEPWHDGADLAKVEKGKTLLLIESSSKKSTSQGDKAADETPSMEKLSIDEKDLDEASPMEYLTPEEQSDRMFSMPGHRNIAVFL